jgi:hypothetical protein
MNLGFGGGLLRLAQLLDTATHWAYLSIVFGYR